MATWCKENKMSMLSLMHDKDFLTSYYRDEMKAKGIDADYNVRLADNHEKRNPTYYNSESAVNKFLGYGSRNDVSGNLNVP